jgi:hypothetical protein
LAWRKKNGIRESVDLEEKNVPTNPALWAKFKAQAKAKFDVYPSAYANGWAAKKYKAAGGGWKTTKESTEMKTFWNIREGSCGTNEEFVVKYAKNKRGPIYQTKFKTQPEAEKFLAQKRKEGMNGIVSKAGKPVSMQKMKDLQKESVEIDESKYNKGAVDKEIKKDRRIKGKEAKAIHSLLKGRTPRKEDVEEKKLTPAELKKREKIAKAIERDNPDYPMAKKMAIATAAAAVK